MTPIALITGGSRGLGRSMALHLAQAGVDVILTFKNRQAEANEVVAAVQAKGRKAVALQLDVGAPGVAQPFAAAVRKTLKDTFGVERFDFLVNNAGHGHFAPFVEATEAAFDDMLAVHLKAPFFLTQALLPVLADGGRILFVSSGLARFSMPGYATYATMKGGVEVLSRYLARELGPRRIAVNVLAPGAIETDFGGGHVRDDAGLNRTLAGLTAQGRVGRPDDIGGVVAALLAPGTGWMTGQRIEASGGMFL